MQCAVSILVESYDEVGLHVDGGVFCNGSHEMALKIIGEVLIGGVIDEGLS